MLPQKLNKSFFFWSRKIMRKRALFSITTNAAATPIREAHLNPNSAATQSTAAWDFKDLDKWFSRWKMSQFCCVAIQKGANRASFLQKWPKMRSNMSLMASSFEKLMTISFSIFWKKENERELGLRFHLVVNVYSKWSGKLKTSSRFFERKIKLSFDLDNNHG